MTPESILEEVAAGEPLINGKSTVHLPPFLVNSRPSHLSGFYRAVKDGWKATTGEMVKLEVIRANGGMATTRPAVMRFMMRLNGASGPTRGEQDRSHAAADNALAAAGL